MAPLRCAVVTGANRGIGLEICRQLLSQGVVVVLTARGVDKGVAAVEGLTNQHKSGSSLGGCLVFHQLDVSDPASVTSLADFIRSKFGKLDILVNNAGVVGAHIDCDVLKSAASTGKSREEINYDEIMKQPYDLAEECLNTNYYGAKRLTETLLPLLCQSESPRIINVSAEMGKLKNIPNAWATRILGDPDNITEEGIDEVLAEFLKDFEEGSVAEKGWPVFLSAYNMSKASLNAYTRVLAKRIPCVAVNCVCPGFVKTDINCNTGELSVEEGAASPVRLALMPHAARSSGLFYVRDQISSF